MELTVKIEGQLRKKLAQAPSIVKSEVQRGVEDASTLLMEESIKTAPKSSSVMSRSIRRELSDLKAVIFPTVDYAFFLHGDETRERSAPFLIPAKEATEGGTLYRWAKKKGMNPWAVRASIAKRGIKHNPWLFKTAKANEGKVKEIFGGVLEKISVALGD